MGVVYLFGLLVIALMLPNSLQVLSQFKPVIEPPTRPPTLLAGFGPTIYWMPTLFWLVFVAVVAVVAVTFVSSNSEFLYWQF